MASRGNSSTYLKNRLKRDHPTFYARLVKGDFPSVHAAARAAGIIKKRTALWTLQGAWRRAPHSEKQAFLRWISSLGEHQIDPDRDRLQALARKALSSLNPREQVRRIRENEERMRACEAARIRRSQRP
jgi:hypothetical protein